MKNKRRDLLSSSLSLMLCCVMLIGTTLAWFTDSAISVGNKIQSGTLKMDLELLDKGTNTWSSIKTSKEAIFDYDKWEPGYTDVKILKIENEGNLALKWYAKFVGEESLGILGDVIDVYVIESKEEALTYPNGRNLDGYTKVGTLNQFVNTLSNTTKGELNPRKSAYLGIALKMQEGAGNEYQGLSIGNPFDITIYATQDTVEADSFGTDYDAEAEYYDHWDGKESDRNFVEKDGVYYINTAAELAGLAELVASGQTFKGETIKLNSNIDLGNSQWTPIGGGNSYNAFKGTFDGQGHTVSNLKIHNEDGFYLGLFGYIEDATIENINVRNANIKSYQQAAAIVGSVKKGIIRNAHVSGNINIVSTFGYAGGITTDGTVEISNSSVIADKRGIIKVQDKTYAGGIASYLYGGSKINNCVVKNLDITSWAGVGGISGLVHMNTEIKGCIVENATLTKTRDGGMGSIGLASGNWVFDGDKKITVKDNTFKNITMTAQSTRYVNELCGSEYSSKTDNIKIEDSNNTIEGTVDNRR